MSDEQTELLRQILAVSREHLEFTRRYRDEAMQLQRTALDRQASHLRLARYAIAFLLVIVVAFLSVMIFGTKEPEQVPPAAAVHQAAEPR